MNRLYYGDNLDVMRQHLASESVDLVYLDPPFNSNRNYNVLFKHKDRTEANAQIEAFDDTWTWSQDDEVLLQELRQSAPIKLADALDAMQRLIGPSDMLSYLVMMAARLIEMRRVLKPTGTLYLHCDPTASHYLKIILDATFGIENFRNEITWRRTSTVKGNAGQGSKHFGRNADSILFYSKTDEYTFNTIRIPYADEYVRRRFSTIESGTGRRFQTVSMTGPGGAAKGNPEYEVLGVRRHWRFSQTEMQRLLDEGRVYQGRPGDVPRQKYYLDEAKGVEIQAIWTDIDAVNSMGKERLGYPTQKPLALLERILLSATNVGDIVLDPFCGCGTTVDAAQRLSRSWTGIDITYLAIDLIDTRLRDTYGEDVAKTYEIVGIPRDLGGARALFARNPFDFERWAVSLVDGTPNQKQVGDKGIDGVIRFPINDKDVGRVIVSVKGGRQVNPAMVRELQGTVDAQRAQLGVLILMDPPTSGMTSAASGSGNYRHELTWRDYPRVQILTVGELLSGKRVNMPTPFMPYLQAKKFVPDHPTLPGFG